MDESQGGSGSLTAGLLRDTVRWSIWVTLAVAVAGALISRDWRFPLACVLAAAVDIAATYWIIRRAEAEAATDITAATASLTRMFVAGRVALKAIVLLVAFALPAYLSLWGAVCGVLILDATLVTNAAITGVRSSFPRLGAKHGQ